MPGGPGVDANPDAHYRHPVDRLHLRIRDQIRGSIPQMGPPALPFLERIESYYLAHTLGQELRLIFANDRRFAVRLEQDWLLDAYQGMPITMLTQMLIRDIAEMYIHEAMRAYPGMVVAVPPRYEWPAPLMYTTGLDPIPEPEVVTTRPWDEAAREHLRRRQRREPDGMAVQTYNGRDAFRGNPYAQELPDDRMMREAREAAYMRARAAMYAQDAGFVWGDEMGRGTITTRHPQAEARGRKLLIDNLTAEQRHDYETKGYFDVIGGDSGARYRILHGTHMNIMALDGRKKNCLCVVPKGKLVHGDVMLMQKLALELEETKALREANHFFWAPEHVALTEEIAKGEAERYAKRCQDSEGVSSR
jgi:hypothetical protein